MVSPCEPPSWLCVNTTMACAWCMEDGNCFCIPQEELTPEPAAPVVEEYVPPVDTTPPVLTLQGAGQLAVTPSGVMIMIDTVQLHGAWVHAGASAWDEEDGNLTSQVGASPFLFPRQRLLLQALS